MVPMFLAALSVEISVSLSKIYNRSLREGEVPNDWRDANVSPIFTALQYAGGLSYGKGIRLSVCLSLRLSVCPSHA